MRFLPRLSVTLLTVLVVFGCAGLEPGWGKPTVMVSSFRALPSSGLAPRFDIGLHIVNPNRSPLELQGIVYTVSLEGHRILTGASNELPVIEGYGEGDVSLTATTNLLSSINLFASLLNQARDTVDYRLEATLDVGGLRPRIEVEERGQVALTGGTRRR